MSALAFGRHARAGMVLDILGVTALSEFRVIRQQDKARLAIEVGGNGGKSPKAHPLLRACNSLTQ